MECMRRFLERYVLLTACAMLAFCVTTRSAHAQLVPQYTLDLTDNTLTYDLNYPIQTSNHHGDHLIFGYWSTANYTNTHINIHAPYGVRDRNEAKNVVHVRVRNADADFDENTVVSFNICLMPGDSWTAALSSEGLMVVDPGECDDDVYQNPNTRTVTHVPTPDMGDMVSLGDANEGFIEAWAAPTGGLVDNSVPCTQAEIDDADNTRCTAATAVAGGPDPDVMPDHATGSLILGTASLVSAMSGFSSTYNATALSGCDVAGSDDPDDTTGDGCRTVNTADDNANNAAADATNIINGVMQGLVTASHYAIVGRWTAIADDNVMSHTKLVLTFAGGNHLLYKGFDKSSADYRAEVTGVDPVSAYVFDDEGALVLRNHEVELGMGVNKCMFMRPGMTDMDTASMMPMLSCNGMEVGMIDGMSGEFRIFNNTAAAVAARDPALPTDNTPADPEVDGSRQITNDGAENEGIGIADNTATPSVNENAQSPAAPLAITGLIFSYFEGTDGKQYDQVTPVSQVFVPGLL